MATAALKGFTTLQESRAAELARILKRFTEIQKNDLTRNIVEKRLETIDRIWDEARETHADIITKVKDASDPYITNNVFAQMEDDYESLQNNLLKALDEYNTPPVKERTLSTGVTDNDDLDAQPRTAKLPKLDLPTFSGRYEDWEDFCDLFTSLVHDAPRLSNVTRLQYLRSCLTGTAADLVRDVSTTNANYQSTWQALKLRFSNPRLTVNNHLTALMDLPYLTKESAEELRRFSDEAQRIVRALTNLEMPVNHWDIWLVYILASRLDPESRKLWESDLSAKDRQAVAKASAANKELSRTERFPSFLEFNDFLEQRSQALCMIAAESKASKRPTQAQARATGNPKRAFHASASSGDPSRGIFARKCSLCSGDHYIGMCPNYLQKSVSDRRNEARRLRLCFNCLGAHQVRNCQSKRTCVTCKEKHHSTLRGKLIKPETPILQQTENTNPTQTQGNLVPPINVTTLTANLSYPGKSVILATAQVFLTGPRGTEIRVRALLDQGSDASYVTESVAQLLELPRCRVQIPITGLGASIAGIARTATCFSLRSVCVSSFQLEVDALILPRLTFQLPSRQIMNLDLSQFNDLTLADPHFCDPDSIDLILGSDVYCQVLQSGLKRFPPTPLIAQETALGWIVSGSMCSSTPRRADVISQAPLTSLHSKRGDELHEVLQQFWKLEEMADLAPKRKPEDIACEQIYINSVSRTSEGRYQVSLPLKSEPPNLSSETRLMALGLLGTIF